MHDDAPFNGSALVPVIRMIFGFVAVLIGGGGLLLVGAVGYIALH